jgi:hypothetical protein
MGQGSKVVLEGKQRALVVRKSKKERKNFSKNHSSLSPTISPIIISVTSRFPIMIGNEAQL